MNQRIRGHLFQQNFVITENFVNKFIESANFCKTFKSLQF